MCRRLCDGCLTRPHTESPDTAHGSTHVSCKLNTTSRVSPLTHSLMRARQHSAQHKRARHETLHMCGRRRLSLVLVACACCWHISVPLRPGPRPGLSLAPLRRSTDHSEVTYDIFVIFFCIINFAAHTQVRVAGHVLRILSVRELCTLSEVSSTDSSDKLSMPQLGSHVTTGGLNSEHVEEVFSFQGWLGGSVLTGPRLFMLGSSRALWIRVPFSCKCLVHRRMPQDRLVGHALPHVIHRLC